MRREERSTRIHLLPSHSLLLCSLSLPLLPSTSVPLPLPPSSSPPRPPSLFPLLPPSSPLSHSLEDTSIHRTSSTSSGICSGQDTNTIEYKEAAYSKAAAVGYRGAVYGGAAFMSRRATQGGILAMVVMVIVVTRVVAMGGRGGIRQSTYVLMRRVEKVLILPLLLLPLPPPLLPHLIPR